VLGGIGCRPLEEELVTKRSLIAFAFTFALAAPWAGCASSPEAPPSSEVALRTTIVHVAGMT
jgi:hypothetical protein